LSDSGDRDAGIAVLRRAQSYHPDDVWINYGLARQLDSLQPPQIDEAIQFYSVARALRAETAHELAHALDLRGRGDEAVVIFEELTTLRPESGRHWTCLAALLKEQGDKAGAQAAANRAVDSDRAALRRSPERAEAHSDLGAALYYAGNPVDAISEYREAIRLKPELAEAHDKLGAALAGQNQTELAVAEYRAAIRLKPDFTSPHRNLAIAFKSQGKLPEAIAEYREAVRLQPGFAWARYELADALRDHEQLDPATAELRETIRRKPDFAEAHAVLGGILCDKGENAEALIEFRRAHELGSRRPDWPYPTELMIRHAESNLKRDDRLAAMVRGDEKLGDPGETLAFAAYGYKTKQYGTSAKLFAAALEADPKLAAEMDSPNRYNAARASALAASGNGGDKERPDDRLKVHWRKQAREWLAADLAHWEREIHSAATERRALAIKNLKDWKADPALASIRGDAALKTLPSDERESWNRLWHQVDEILDLAARHR